MRRKLISLTSLVLLLGLVAETAIADPNLVGYWKFDETSGDIAYDSSGNKSDGTLISEAAWAPADGKLKGAVSFGKSDTDRVEISTAGITPVAGTVALWARLEGAQSGYRFLFGCKNDDGNRIQLYMDGYNTKLDMGLGNQHSRHLNITTLAIDTWYHIALTWDGGNYVVYVDGVAKADGAYAGLITLPSVANIGNNGDAIEEDRHQAFHGLIDDVRIYNRRLNKNEINTICTLEKTDLSGFDKISDTEIARDPDKVLQEAYEKLQEFGNWHANPTIRTEHAGEIAGTLLAIARAKEAKNHPVEEVLDDYYDITKQFPDSPQAIRALCKLATIDEKNGWEYAVNFLAKDTTGTKAAQFYEALIKHYMTELDYVNVEKYIKLFINKYGSTKNGVKFMTQLMDSVGQVREREQLDKIIERSVAEDPNSAICCAVFRQRALAFSKVKDFTQLLEMAKSVRRKFPETKLAACAAAVLADNEYQDGNFVFALEAFKPGLFAEHRPEPVIIKDIDSALTLYNANTLRTQGIDLGKIYEALAKYAHDSRRSTIAVHCYRQSAKVKGFSLDAFEDAAPETVKYCNTGPENEVWFWKGLLAAEEGDLMTASMIHERFLEVDDASILAARAFCSVARARMALGWYAKAEDAIAKAKLISPCQPVIELEQELAKTNNR